MVMALLCFKPVCPLLKTTSADRPAASTKFKERTLRLQHTAKALYAPIEFPFAVPPTSKKPGEANQVC